MSIIAKNIVVIDMIILIVGDFGVGKDTFANMLLTHFGLEYAQLIRSKTTRKPRYENEITHEFLTIQDYENDQDNIVAQTKIDDQYYWTTKDQFEQFFNGFSIYVVDDIGVRDVIQSDIDDVYIIEVIRPSWLIEADPQRLNRERQSGTYKYKPNYRVINDKTFEYLDSIARDIAYRLKDEMK